jgi:DNA-binding NarL/FixJ family response regulator
VTWKHLARRLEGRIVTLEPLALEHEPALFAAAQDPEVWRWMPWNAAETRATFHAWLEEALAASEEFAVRFGLYRESPGTPWRVLRAEALDRLGRTDEARMLATADVERARAFGAPHDVGRALRVLGRIEREEGVQRLEEAVEVLAGSTARLERAKALLALGAARRRGRAPAAAREPLREALELASACGAPPIADAARSELYAAGARPRTDALSGLGALTASERRVVDLAATGETNRDIAQALYVTPKTVEVHLSNAYRKLGIRSRRDLPHALEAA